MTIYEYMHSQGILHGDVSAKHWLVSHDHDRDHEICLPSCKMMVIDFEGSTIKDEVIISPGSGSSHHEGLDGEKRITELEWDEAVAAEMDEVHQVLEEMTVGRG